METGDDGDATGDRGFIDRLRRTDKTLGGVAESSARPGQFQISLPSTSGARLSMRCLTLSRAG